MVLSKKRDFCKRNGKRYGDVFMGSKMMKFQNKRLKERWIVGMLVCGLVLFI